MAITAKKQLEWLKNRGQVKYFILDLEVENHKYKGRVASPFCADNWIVMAGWKRFDDEHCHCKHMPRKGVMDLVIPTDVDLIVGHNLKFDLLWLWDNPSMQAFIQRGGKVWDTQTVEWLINGQAMESQLTSMDQIIEIYGGRKKIDAVKELWEQGYKTSEIDPQMLRDYLIGTKEEGYNSGDIGNTELIFKGQWKRARIQNQLPMIENRMGGYRACIEAEWNGLFIDMELGESLRKVYQEKKDKAEKDLYDFIKHVPEEVKFNWNSGDHLSYLLYGGHMPYDIREQKKDSEGNLLYAIKMEPGPILDDDGNYTYYKSGKRKGEIRTKQFKVPDPTRPKMHTVTKYFRFDRMVKPKEEWVMQVTSKENKKKKIPKKNAFGEKLYKSNSDIMDYLFENNDLSFLDSYFEFNSLKKDLSTYYFIEDTDKDGNIFRKGMLALVTDKDSILHGILQWASTITSRLSSKEPNLQNLPNSGKSEVRKVFKSRFENGWMSEIDYSQLEVVILGVLSKDPQLTQDLLDGIDFHCVRVAMKYKEHYPGGYAEVKAIMNNEHHPRYKETKKRRTICKILSFQKQYGAGAKTIAKTVGIPVEEVKEILELEDNRYAGVVEFNKMVANIVDLNKAPKSVRYRNSVRPINKLRSSWTSPTGTVFTFEATDAPDFMQERGIKLSFSPPNLKNYPIQGTGGEMVQTAIGKMFDKLVSLGYWSGGDKPFALFCNTVHDCVWFDFKDLETAEKLIPIISKELESIPDVFNDAYDMDIKVPFPVEAELGRSMYELHGLEDVKERLEKENFLYERFRFHSHWKERFWQDVCFRLA